jgi:hypothetical protein
MTSGELELRSPERTAYLVDRALDIVATRSRSGEAQPFRLPVPPARRAYWRRFLERRARERGLDVFAVYRGGRAKALDIFVIREKGDIRP